MRRFGLILLVALAGCGKKPAPAPVVTEAEPPPVAAPAPIRTTPRAAPVADSPTPVAAGKPAPSIQDQLQGTVHPEMTMRLRLFEQMKGRLPQNFYELQNMGGFDSTPGLPPNLMYVIDPKDKTVKIVKK